MLAMIWTQWIERMIESLKERRKTELIWFERLNFWYHFGHLV